MDGNFMLHSPLSYTGGKTRLMDQLLDYFPKRIDTFVDLFCGGLNVSINVDCKSVIANDVIPQLIEAFEMIKNKYSSFDDLDNCLNRISEKYNLGFSSNSVNLFNEQKGNETENYNGLRDDYNMNPNPEMFLMLVFCSFNHQIRFNKYGKFNMPNGLNRGRYTNETRNDLRFFYNAIHSRNYDFRCGSFMDFQISSLKENDFVYCDPPYLITTASYNEKNSDCEEGWTEKDEVNLYSFLDNLNDNGIKFGLSNVCFHHGIENRILSDWMKKYIVRHLKMDYSNCSYHLKDRNNISDEVYVTNYDSGFVEKKNSFLEF